MKCVVGLVVVALALEGVLALPARLPNEDAEEIEVPRRSSRPRGLDADSEDDVEPAFRDFRGVIDTKSGYPFLQPAPHPFSFNLGFFDSFEDIFRRLHSRLLPALGGAADEDDSGDSGSVGVNFGLGGGSKKGNTTSTVKIVDGHKIEINDTVYGDENSLFKVRIVNVRPLESGEEGADGSPVTSAPTGGSAEDKDKDNDAEDKEDTSDDSDERREPLALDKKPDENEIKGNIDDPEIIVAIEMLPTDNGTADALNLEAPYVTDNSLGEADDESPETKTGDQTDLEQGDAVVPELQDEDAEREEQEDEQEDLEVGDGDESDVESLGEDEAAPTAPTKERENFESSDDEDEDAGAKVPMSPEYNSEWGLPDEEEVEDLSNELSNDIEEAAVGAPFDLSNDLAVNDIAAAQPGFPLNPDAEFIELAGGPRTGDGSAMMARFEKLSMDAGRTHQAYSGK